MELRCPSRGIKTVQLGIQTPTPPNIYSVLHILNLYLVYGPTVVAWLKRNEKSLGDLAKSLSDLLSAFDVFSQTMAMRCRGHNGGGGSAAAMLRVPRRRIPRRSPAHASSAGSARRWRTEE